MSQDLEPERKQELTNVALKVAAVVLGIGVVVGLGSWLLVEGLDLDAGTSGAVAQPDVQPVDPLPSSALPVPSESPPEDPHGQETLSTPPSPTGGELQLHATPSNVSEMERINLTGSWAGKDNVTLSVQRFESGQWTDFGVSATVRVGTYETWVMTGREGEQRFRMYDPQTDTASNEVSVTVG